MGASRKNGRNGDGMQEGTLTDAQIKAERKLLEGVPRVNIGALLLPPIWGPAHGIWATIIFYPLWIVADTCFVNAVAARTPLAIGIGAIVFAALLAGTVAFSIVSQPFALHRALAMGQTKERYLHRQRIWAVASIIVGVAALTAATVYNLHYNPEVVAALELS